MQQGWQGCGKSHQKVNLHFWLEFRKWLNLFPASYGATPQLQHNISDISSWRRVVRI